MTAWLPGAAINTDRNLRLQYLAGAGLNGNRAGEILRALIAPACAVPRTGCSSAHPRSSKSCASDWLDAAAVTSARRALDGIAHRYTPALITLRTPRTVGLFRKPAPEVQVSPAAELHEWPPHECRQPVTDQEMPNPIRSLVEVRHREV